MLRGSAWLLDCIALEAATVATSGRGCSCERGRRSLMMALDPSEARSDVMLGRAFNYLRMICDHTRDNFLLVRSS